MVVGGEEEEEEDEEVVVVVEEKERAAVDDDGTAARLGHLLLSHDDPNIRAMATGPNSIPKLKESVVVVVVDDDDDDDAVDVVLGVVEIVVVMVSVVLMIVVAGEAVLMTTRKSTMLLVMVMMAAVRSVLSCSTRRECPQRALLDLWWDTAMGRTGKRSQVDKTIAGGRSGSRSWRRDPQNAGDLVVVVGGREHHCQGEETGDSPMLHSRAGRTGERVLHCCLPRPPCTILRHATAAATQERDPATGRVPWRCASACDGGSQTTP